ncbi:uncharacterized protein LOC133791186 [Humulus lupulus]|uniref:uncharacterized protein LOC133791186 n=1 Tax=Humulus lupulus TaxID=3486 RepID=UPI002B407A8B|nr:uncharacterized protein LOC133791186 [Humulus lupulus]
MANTLVTRAATDRNLNSIFKLSLNFFRSFSTESPSPPSPSPSASKKPKRKKKKNLFEVAQFLPNWGLGYHMAKTHWTGVSYEITKINLYKDGRHGKAWGIVHKEGLAAADAPKKISGVHKRCWKYIPNLTKSLGSEPSMAKPSENVSKDNAQAA